MNWGLKSGVIVIGSLLWQDYLEKQGDNIRVNWRNSNLDMESKIPVRVPIRYGRISQNKGIPTMIYSNRMKNRPGFGYAIPFQNSINNAEELLKEAIALSVAEGMKGNFIRKWGALSYLLNENRIDSRLKKEIIKIFKNRKEMDLNIDEYKVLREKSCLTKSLKLNIDWLQPIDSKDRDSLDRFDFLMAVVTQPLPNDRLLSFDEIAQRVASDNERRYFINNLGNGIITQDDFEISKRL